MMEADLSLAVSTCMKLARTYRVVTDEDILDQLPQAPASVRRRAVERLMHDRILHPRLGRYGFDSAIYDGAISSPF